jgi:hypothetical protein
MTTTPSNGQPEGGRLDRAEAILLQLAEGQAAHDPRMDRIEAALDRLSAALDRTGQIVESNARAIEANSAAIAQLRAAQAQTEQTITNAVLGMVDALQDVTDRIERLEGGGQ